MGTQRFRRDFLGRTVILNGRPYTLIGVTPRGFGGTTVVIEPDYYVPLSAHDLIEWELIAGNKTLARRDYHRLLLIARLRPGMDIAAPTATSRRLRSGWSKPIRRRMRAGRSSPGRSAV